MKSPFPGMDPHLEHPGRWPDVHHELITEIRAQLNGKLRPGYHARIEERVYVTDDRDPGRTSLIPDVHVTATEGAREAPSRGPEAGDNVEPLVVTTFIEDEIHSRASRSSIARAVVSSRRSKC